MLSGPAKDKDANTIYIIDPNKDLRRSILNKELDKEKEHKVDKKEGSLRGERKEGFFVNLMPDHLVNSPEFIEIWGDWIEYRKEVRRKLTPTAVKRQLALLGKFSPDVAVAMIDKSIISGWQGIFELRKGHPLLDSSELADPGAQRGEILRSIR